MFEDYAATIDQIWREVAEEIADDGAAFARELGLTADASVPESGRGDWHALLKAAETSRAAVLLVGSRGRGAVASTVLGSVASALVHAAAVPVLVVGGLRPSRAPTVRNRFRPCARGRARGLARRGRRPSADRRQSSASSGKAVDALPEPAREVVEGRFGLDGDPRPESHTTIGRRLGKSPNEMRAIERAVLADLSRLRELQALARDV